MNSFGFLDYVLAHFMAMVTVGLRICQVDERADGIIVCDSCKRPSRPAKVGNIHDARCPHCTRRPSLRLGRPALRNRFRRRPPLVPPHLRALFLTPSRARPWPPRHVAPCPAQNNAVNVIRHFSDSPHARARASRRTRRPR